MPKKSIKVIITGATGMVGEGVMHVCLQNPNIDTVLVINRKPCGVAHPKLKEVIHADFFDLTAIENELIGYDTCFFCLGVSSVGMSADDYYKFTYTLTLNFAKSLVKTNDGMTFSYVSGAGTDSTEKGMSRWARVKGKTENDLMALPFKSVYAFRPAFIKPIEGMQRTHAFYKYINWLFPLGRAIYRKGFCTLNELANAMIFLALSNQKTCVVEGDEIIKLGTLI
ncbi:MAG: NAD-dependent epimerase/dehydratase family protein [Pedobacter sp.]|nr:NAD-dependent epimerase/dehydratase family protein [Chitinophagaceae bacterium]